MLRDAKCKDLLGFLGKLFCCAVHELGGRCWGAAADAILVFGAAAVGFKRP